MALELRLMVCIQSDRHNIRGRSQVEAKLVQSHTGQERKIVWFTQWFAVSLNAVSANRGVKSWTNRSTKMSVPETPFPFFSSLSSSSSSSFFYTNDAITMRSLFKKRNTTKRGGEWEFEQNWIEHKLCERARASWRDFLFCKFENE